MFIKHIRKNLAIGENTDRAIILDEDKISEKEKRGLKNVASCS